MDETISSRDERRRTEGLAAGENAGKHGLLGVSAAIATLVGARALWRVARKTEELVRIVVKAGYEDDFVRATQDNVRHSRRENGNLKFDLYRHRDNERVFLLHEVFTSKRKAARHKHENHYTQWADTVSSWMDLPRTRVNPTQVNLHRDYVKIL